MPINLEDIIAYFRIKVDPNDTAELNNVKKTILSVQDTVKQLGKQARMIVTGKQYH